MSCYEWERGEFLLPSKDYPSFRRKMLEAWNAEQDRIFDLAKRAYETILAQAKGKRGFDKDKALSRLFGCWIEGEGAPTAIHPFTDSDDHEPVRRLLFGEYSEEHRCLVTSQYDPKKQQTVPLTKMHAPRKKDLAYLPVSKGGVLRMPEAAVAFCDERRTVKWVVGENNRACDRAREHRLAKVFFRALSEVQWTRGSGGKIVGNDEYNRETHGEGEGANYVKDTYGPRGADGIERMSRRFWR